MRSTRGKMPLSWKPIIKLAVTGLAVYWVGRQIALDETAGWLATVPGYMIVGAFILFNLSKVIGAIRLNLFFSLKNIGLPEIENIKLYYKGMFYNLFLPGGIGGDGYKAFHLRRISSASWADIFSALISDRLSGAVAMIFMAMLLTVFHPSIGKVPLAQALVIAAAVLTYPVFYFLTVIFFSAFKPTVVRGTLLAIIIQALQTLVAVIILSEMNIAHSMMLNYLIVFLLSSIATIIPITIGGIGTRELVFLTAAEYTGIEPDKAVAFSLIFFSITAVSSLAGSFLTLRKTNDQPGPAVEPATTR